MRSVEHLGRSGIVKKPINAKKVKCDGPTKRGVESLSTRLKMFDFFFVGHTFSKRLHPVFAPLLPPKHLVGLFHHLR